MLLHRTIVLELSALLLALTLPALGLAGQCTTTANIENPLPFQWTYVASPEPHYVGTMEIAEATLSPGGAFVGKLFQGPAFPALLKRCRDGWCQMEGQGFAGWIARDQLWGVYPDEDID